MIIEEIKDRDDLYHLNLTADEVLVLARCVEYVRLHSVFPYKVDSDLDFLSRAFSDFFSRLDLPF
jgi:hypothetical protein